MHHNNTLFIEYTVITFKYLGKLFTTIYVQLCSKQKSSGHWVKLGVLNNSKKKPKNKHYQEGKHKHHRGNTKLDINHQCEWR